jgi:S-adenosylmethionine:tRNA ribosyltransferase-isomerase
MIEGRQHRTSDFEYQLPEHLIAQRPLADRAASRLLTLSRKTGAIMHGQFRDLPTYFDPGDVLVLNASRVIPARLSGTRSNNRPAELLLLHPEPDGTWLAMVHPGGKLKIGRTVRFGTDTMAEVVEVLQGGVRRVRFRGPLAVADIVACYGAVPLPPYIRRPPDAEDRHRYQTVFARVDGSVAAPTAGLHFTHELLDQIRQQGVHVVEIVLHVGPGTFKPVMTDDPAAHRLHPEWYEIPELTTQAVREARLTGHRVWAVGTTVVRTLETTDRGSGWTGLLITPGFRFRVVDAMLTNFHLPRSTLLMLTAAFAGFENTMAAYREAVSHEYRFYSYGDAMAVM